MTKQSGILIGSALNELRRFDGSWVCRYSNSVLSQVGEYCWMLHRFNVGGEGGGGCSLMSEQFMVGGHPSCKALS